jgi:uncharacterized membrane protein
MATSGSPSMREVEIAANESPNAMVSRLLSIGITAALGLIALGLVLAVLRPIPAQPEATPFAQLPAAVLHGDPIALVSLGLVVLLATPAARVVALAIAYARRREWSFAAIALTVLSVLVLSFVIGISH